MIFCLKKIKGSVNAPTVKYFEEGTNSKYMTTVSFCKYRTRGIRLDRFLFLNSDYHSAAMRSGCAAPFCRRRESQKSRSVIRGLKAGNSVLIITPGCSRDTVCLLNLSYILCTSLHRSLSAIASARRRYVSQRRYCCHRGTYRRYVFVCLPRTYVMRLIYCSRSRTQ